jgi:ubiquinone/menaquinone biosynthesis C-methylase UbiE
MEYSNPQKPEFNLNYTDPFQNSAKIYDLTSRYVPYDFWADFIYQILDKHNKLKITTILELSCGTGSFRTFFQSSDDIRYFCSDISLTMIKGAKIKFSDSNLSQTGFCQDNRWLGIKSKSMDLVMLFFDSINYMLTDDDVRLVLNEAARVLKPNGLLIFDFTTPANSLENNPEDFSEIYEESESAFNRISRYDKETQIHSTIFEMHGDNGSFTESHIEKTYTIDQMKENIFSVSSLKLEALYDEFDLRKPNEESQRIHAVLRKR